MENVIIEPRIVDPAPRRGRPTGPPVDPQVLAARVAAKKEYQKKWYAEHKAEVNNKNKAYVARAKQAKRFMCPYCEMTFACTTHLRTHL